MSERKENFEQGKGKYEPWYKDSDFTVCPTCDSPGRFAPDIWGKDQFYHVADRGNGYFGFDEGHQTKKEGN